MCLSNLRDKNPGVLTAVGENVHAVDVSGPGRAEERRQCAHLIRMPQRPAGISSKIVFFMCDLPDLDTAQAALKGPPVLCFY